MTPALARVAERMLAAPNSVLYSLGADAGLIGAALGVMMKNFIRRLLLTIKFIY
jgi:hypothetical protein